MNSKDELTEALISRLGKKEMREGKSSNVFSAYVGTCPLNYELLAVGRTEQECMDNLIAEFETWATDGVEEWVTNVANENFEDYDNDTWTFLHDYYGAYVQLVKGHSYIGA